MTPSPTNPPSIHEATCATDGSGGVHRGRSLTRAEAIAHRRSGGDVIVCGDDTPANDKEARAIESAVGPCIHDPPHLMAAGPRALPHWQQNPPPPAGHTFYETHVRKALP